VVKGNHVWCDGGMIRLYVALTVNLLIGDGPLGHPKVYINLVRMMGLCV